MNSYVALVIKILHKYLHPIRPKLCIQTPNLQYIKVIYVIHKVSLKNELI